MPDMIYLNNILADFNFVGLHTEEFLFSYTHLGYVFIIALY